MRLAYYLLTLIVMVKVLDFCILKFYNNYVICIINKGVHLSVELSDKMVEIALNYYSEKPFVYITQRLHKYTVDSDVYVKISKLNTLAGFVVVSDEKPSIKNALLEKLFLDKPFQIFNNLDDAILWANNIRSMNGNDYSKTEL